MTVSIVLMCINQSVPATPSMWITLLPPLHVRRHWGPEIKYITPNHMALTLRSWGQFPGIYIYTQSVMLQWRVIVLLLKYPFKKWCWGKKMWKANIKTVAGKIVSVKGQLQKGRKSSIPVYEHFKIYFFYMLLCSPICILPCNKKCI